MRVRVMLAIGLSLVSEGLQPVAEGLSAQGTPPPEIPAARECPQCGWLPQAATLADEADVQGNRRLVCALCAFAWSYPRALCPSCGSTGEDGLEFHVDQALPHLRVEACRRCHGYLKSVDLRVVGFAEPFVDDLATPELDLWASEQGLEKISPNLFGL